MHYQLIFLDLMALFFIAFDVSNAQFQYSTTTFSQLQKLNKKLELDIMNIIDLKNSWFEYDRKVYVFRLFNWIWHS